jgi:crotonobetainyl-CoA:carnitine CoA-transferase CaiB-like acyl-CoA transferase
MFDLLKGTRIIDLTTIVLGPYATQMLADLGADVIKVESPAGDAFRAVRPARRDDLGVGFLAYNRNKRSVVLDLKQPRAREVLKKMVAESEVLVHNMRSRSAAGLGLGYDELSKINPGLVYCYSPGFGELGPDRDAPAYDDIIQSRSGLAALNADPSGAPQYVRTIACDKTVGLHLALAVASGLVKRATTGEGVCIETPMLESMVSFLLSEHLAGHTLVPPEGELGYDRMMSPNRKPYRTQDGYLTILPYTTRHWVRFFQICGLDDWATADKVIDAGLRSDHIDELYGKVAELAAGRTTADWMSVLADKDIPCARVNSLDDLFTDSHLVAAGMFTEVEDERIGTLRQLRSPFQVNGELAPDAGTDQHPPGLGEHTSAVLESFGYTTDEISEMRGEGMLG